MLFSCERMFFMKRTFFRLPSVWYNTVPVHSTVHGIFRIRPPAVPHGSPGIGGKFPMDTERTEFGIMAADRFLMVHPAVHPSALFHGDNVTEMLEQTVSKPGVFREPGCVFICFAAEHRSRPCGQDEYRCQKKQEGRMIQECHGAGCGRDRKQKQCHSQCGGAQNSRHTLDQFLRIVKQLIQSPRTPVFALADLRQKIMGLCFIPFRKIHGQQFFRKKMVFLERIFRMNHLTPTIQRAGQEGQERRYAKCECNQRPKNIGAG